MAVHTIKAVRTHHYRHDPATGRCTEPGLHGSVCGLPKENRHHRVKPVDPDTARAEQRRIGEHHQEVM